MTEQEAVTLRGKLVKAMNRIFQERGYDFTVVPEEGHGYMGVSVEASGDVDESLFNDVMNEAVRSIGAGDFLSEIDCSIEHQDE